MSRVDRSRLAGRVALVTGGTRGLGRHLVAELADRGAVVRFCGRDRSTVAAVAAAVPGAIGHTADLAVSADRRRLVDEVRAGGRLDLLVNNAAIGRIVDLASPGGPGPRDEIEVDLVAPIELTLALLPDLRRSDAAAIVNVGSALAEVPLAAEPFYCAAKAGLHAWSRSLREQVAGDGIAVLEALLPTVDTDLAAPFDVHKRRPDEVARRIVEALAVGRPELRLGQARALHVMSRVAPRLIFRKLNDTPVASTGSTSTRPTALPAGR